MSMLGSHSPAAGWSARSSSARRSKSWFTSRWRIDSSLSHVLAAFRSTLMASSIALQDDDRAVVSRLDAPSELVELQEDLLLDRRRIEASMALHRGHEALLAVFLALGVEGFRDAIRIDEECVSLPELHPSLGLRNRL